MRVSNVLLILMVFAVPLSLAAADFSRSEMGVASEEQAEAKAHGARRLPNVALGLGGYFLQPHEITGAASHAPPVIARPLLLLRVEQILGQSPWLFEPHAGFLFPRGSDENTTVLSGFFNADFGYGLGSRFVLSGGIGVHPTLTLSSGSTVEIGGEFVTPSGSALSWVFTNNLGLAFWVDEHFRVDAGTAVSRLFDDVGRRFRYFLEVAYAI